ncbi:MULTISPECIES: DUF4043 domain-containing protein [Acetobacter]|uniref:DUF4043 domain-containing protein n=2 Tax=Acetobacter TaxID=434 RepID=A0AAN1PJT4_9PROT|nr:MULTISPECIES: DUF4043 domain-containing protein [Acetobacter]ASL39314.1 DUF4043 domain-containing protein [Acetobacter oryzifermentans]AXN01441.1 DUF4043 domain-containing protein [Acetobacter pomorum]KAA8397167.1 DUF4043 domain-containing protein [Acetobacter sp. DmW_125124]KAA8397713.1 DUF4043 domain-containing protein [Acetobacter sp. DmW_125127]KAA8401115.1 DUF4043 domain-containing protein [Acetobacter sp. DmW_125128]
MAIADFPAVLQPIIQQGFLARAFEASLESKLGFRSIADRMDFPARIGQTITDTRRGLLAPVEAPLNPASNTNFDNGMSPTEWSVEQYTLEIAQFGNTMDLNQVTEGVGIANQFVQNAQVLGINARQSLDRLARNSLFGGAIGGVGGYLGGNTRVTTALAAAGTTIQVDDIRGFQRVMNDMGQVIPVSATSGMTVTIGSGSYTLTNVAADATNVSKAPGGISGTLTFSGNVATTDATENAAVVAATAPLVLRPNGRATTAALLASGSKDANGNVATGDYLTIDTMLGAVAALRNNNVPTIDGCFNCFLDNSQLLGLFRDPDFKLLYRGQYGSDEYRTGQVFELLGIRFIPTTEAPQQASLGQGQIHRAIICGAGALIEGDYANMAQAYANLPGEVEHIDDVLMVTRPPLDRLGQIIAQSWSWIGGFALPTDLTANTTIIPTATNSYLKRGVVIESLGATSLGATA